MTSALPYGPMGRLVRQKTFTYNCLLKDRKEASGALLKSFSMYHARIQKALSEGSKFDNVFLADEGIEDTNFTINGPSSVNQRNAI